MMKKKNFYSIAVTAIAALTVIMQAEIQPLGWCWIPGFFC